MEKNNTVYRNQFACMALISAVTFKMVMLPQYMARIAGNNSYISIAIMMCIEIAMYSMVYLVSSRINFIKEDNKALMIPIMAVLYVVMVLRMTILFSETVSYTATTLFDQGRSSFIILGFLPIIGYLVYKGGNNIGRLATIVMWAVLALIFFLLLFSSLRIDWANLLPIMPDGPTAVLSACDKYYLWFGDFLPLLFFSVVKDKNRKLNKYLLPIIFVSIVVVVVAFYMIFVGVYNTSGELVNFAFNKMAVFNKISELIGATNFPVVIVWILMAIVKLGLLLYTMTVALAYFIKSRKIALIINVLLIACICGFGVTTMADGYALAVMPGIRYFVAAVQYSVPIILLIYTKVKYGKKANKA